MNNIWKISQDKNILESYQQNKSMKKLLFTDHVRNKHNQIILFMNCQQTPTCIQSLNGIKNTLKFNNSFSRILITKLFWNAKRIRFKRERKKGKSWRKSKKEWLRYKLLKTHFMLLSLAENFYFHEKLFLFVSFPFHFKNWV